MRRFPIAVLVTLLLTGLLTAQSTSRQQRVDQIKNLNEKIDMIVKDLLRPSQEDIDAAGAAGLNVVRLLPREVYGGILPVPLQGGAFYSFSNGSHDYGKISQIMFEQNRLGVGFAGADYGFIADLGNRPISRIDFETMEVGFLTTYKPPKLITDIRNEQGRSHRYEAGPITYSSRMPANVGHTYALRAISFDRADILVLFTIIRKDEDGSLILLWKQLLEFEKPFILYAPDSEIKAVVDRIISERGLRITVDVQDNKLIWLGSPTNEEMRELRIGMQGKEVRIRGEDFSKRRLQR